VLLAWFGTPAVRALGPADLPRLAQATLDTGVLTVSLAAAVISVFVFGLGPAVFVTRGKLFDSLREGAPSVEGGSRKLRDLLVVSQFALAVVVVLGAGLMVRSFDRLLNVQLGFEPERAMSFGVGLPDGVFTAEERVAFLQGLEEQLGGLPGVEAVGLTMSAPFGPFQASNFVAPAEDVPDRQEDFTPVSWRAVTAGFFPAAGIELVAGRVFDPQDGPPVGGDMEAYEMPVILDENLAERLWNRPDAVGEAVVWGDPNGTTMRVVGVVAAARDERVDGPPRPRIYLPYAVFPWPEPVVLVRSATDPTALVPAVRDVVRRLDADVPVIGAASLGDALRNAVAWPRFTMQVLAAFGLFAVLLAGMGIYGIAAFGVARRRREIGIRVALGAEPKSVVGLVLRAAIRLAVVGMALGVILALAASGFVEALLYDTRATDPLTFVAVPLLLGGVALLASWLPARRATRIHPTEALSGE
jgi:predicted permease